MSKKADKLRRIVDKLTQHYGSDDSVVQRLQSELDMLEAFEFRYPSKFDKKVSVKAFCTPAKQLFYAKTKTPVH